MPDWEQLSDQSGRCPACGLYVQLTPSGTVSDHSIGIARGLYKKCPGVGKFPEGELAKATFARLFAAESEVKRLRVALADAVALAEEGWFLLDPQIHEGNDVAFRVAALRAVLGTPSRPALEQLLGCTE